MGSDNPIGADDQQETAASKLDERPREATGPKLGGDPCRILRDCTPGALRRDAISGDVKIQSDPHGDMGSQAEMT